jgi:hypothetical protein
MVYMVGTGWAFRIEPSPGGGQTESSPSEGPDQKRFIYRLLTRHDSLPMWLRRQVTRLEAENYVPDRLLCCTPRAAKPVIKSKYKLRPGQADLHLLVGS